MAIYILTGQNSELTGGADFNKVLNQSYETATSITVAVAASATETSLGFTKPGTPNNSDWETAGITVEVNVTTANSNIQLDVRATRINSGGTVQESSAFAGEIQLGTTGVKTFNIPSTNWTAGNATDRLRIDYKFRNTDTKSRSVVIQTGTTNAEVITSITDNPIEVSVTANKDLVTTRNAQPAFIYVHSGLSNVLLGSFASPGFSPLGLTFDTNGNLISNDNLFDHVFRHSGVSNVILGSFSTPDQKSGG